MTFIPLLYHSSIITETGWGLCGLGKGETVSKYADKNKQTKKGGGGSGDIMRQHMTFFSALRVPEATGAATKSPLGSSQSVKGEVTG